MKVSGARAGFRNSILVSLGSVLLLAAPRTPALAEFVSLLETPEAVEFVWQPDPSADPAGQVGPDLPAIWVALPPGGEAALSFQVEGRRTIPNALSPEDTRVLAQDWSGDAVQMQVPTWVRDRYGVQVVVRPWELRADGGWSEATGIRVRVAIRDGGEPRRAASERDPFARLYERVFINAESSRGWQRVPSPKLPLRGQDYFSNADGDWVRVRVKEEGIHEITGGDLALLGVSLGSIDPATLRMFSGRQLPLPEDLSVDEVPGWMEEIAISVLETGGPDGSFDSSDRIVFLGHAADDWYVNKGTDPTPNERFARDPYSNDSVYWLTWGGSFSGTPVRMQEIDGTGASGPYVDRVRDRMHLEENRIYSPRQKEAGNQPADWEEYWWRELQTTEVGTSAQRVTVQIPDPIPGDPIDVFARFWGENAPISSSEIPDHDLTVELNDHILERIQWDGRTRRDLSVSGTWLDPGDEQVFRLVGTPWDDPNIVRFDIVLLAFIEVAYTRTLNLRDGRIAFFTGGLSGPQPLEIQGVSDGRSADDVWILDTDDPFRPTRIQGEIAGNTVRFRADLPATAPSRYVVFESDRFLTPTLELRPVPEDGYLRERTDPVQMVIISHSSLLGEAEPLAEYRRENFPDRGTADVAVIDVEQIYDEFSFGRKDPTAIRNFLQYIRDRWTGGVPEDGPAFVLLFGDAHRDHRSLVVVDAPDLVPTYTRYYDFSFASTIYDPRFSSDDYFGLLDGPQDHGLDMYIGRLVAQNPAQARSMARKIRIYEQESALGDWRNEATLVADDICQGIVDDGLSFLHMVQTETLAQNFLPETIEQNKIYLYEYGAECIFTNKPEAASDLLRAMNEGTLLVNYTGHGGETQISDERVFEVSNIGNLTNEDRLFFMLTASCSIGKFDSSSESLSEGLMRYGNGGTIGVFAAASVAFATGNARVNQLFYLEAFPDKCAACSRPIGEAAAIAKLRLESTGLNQRRYALHGDPCVALLTPRNQIALSMRNARTGETLSGEIRRGTLVELSGEVRDLSGVLLEDFDGTASVQVFDSEIVRQPDPHNATRDYTLAGAPIYRGTAEVTAGHLTTRFVVPTSLRAGIRGNAQIYVYAADGRRDAAGAFADLVIPETAPPPSPDASGPTIQFAFVEPGEVIRPEAEYTASLFDSSGINMTGLAPSRSAVLRLEQNGVTVFAEDLSSQIEFGDDFRSATLTHRLPGNLPEGPYEAELRAFDNLNFGSSFRTSFLLANSGDFDFSLGRIFNMPNPTERGTHFFAEIPEDADIDVDIFTLSGRRIRSLGPVRLSPETAGSSGIEWDGYDDDGDRLANGVYFYKVTGTSVRTGETRSEIGRLVVSR